MIEIGMLIWGIIKLIWITDPSPKGLLSAFRLFLVYFFASTFWLIFVTSILYITEKSEPLSEEIENGLIYLGSIGLFWVLIIVIIIFYYEIYDICKKFYGKKVDNFFKVKE